MASRKTTGLFYNLILTLALFLLLMTSLLGLEIPTTVALEQHPRCGLSEHQHTEDCYLGEVLLCSRKAHAHSQSCYLVNLQDNDINALLHTLSEDGDRSLEDLIRSVMSRALDSSPEHSAESALTQLSQKDIATLNDTIRGDDSIPDLLLNQNLGTGITLQYTPIEPGIALLAVNPTTRGPALNFYIYVIDENGTDGSWVCINNEHTYNYSGWTQLNGAWYTRYISASTVYSVFNAFPGVSFDSTNDFSLRYATSTNGTYSNGSAGTFSNQPVFTFGSDWGNDYVLYARLYQYNSNNAMEFCKLTYKNGNNTTEQYVARNVAIPVANPPAGYVWQDKNGNTYQAGQTITLNASQTLTAVQAGYTVTFNENYDGGQSHDVTVAKNTAIPEDDIPDVSREGYTLVGWYTDADCTDAFHFGSTITGNKTLYAKWIKNHTVTFHYQNDAADTTQEVAPGGTVSAPTAPTWEGHTFSGWYTDAACSDGNAYNFSTAVDADLDLYAKWIPNVYTVTVLDEDGNVAGTHSIRHGRTFTLGELPNGHLWVDNNNNTYASGVNITVTQDLTLRPVAKTITVNYNVKYTNNSVPNNLRPTIYGTTSSTAKDIVPGGDSVTTRSLNSRTVTYQSRNTIFSQYFLGWSIDGQDVILPPGSVLSWEQLESYADANGNVNLVGEWEKVLRYTSVSFYINYAGKAMDAGGNVSDRPVSDFTPYVFGTYVGGIDPELLAMPDNTTSQTNAKRDKLNEAYRIVDDTSDNSYDADKAIRAMYGERDDGIWLYDFPTDDEVFAYLKDHLASSSTAKLTIDGEDVDPDDLDTEHYSVRWYVFKLESVDWHVDGRLVKKVGTVTVDKNFYGEDAAIQQAKQGFHIIAENGTKNADGSFTPYTGSKYRQIVMTLDQSTANSLKATYPNAEFMVLPTAEAAGSALEWKITNVTLGEYWKIVEKPNSVTNYSYYAEYSVHDTDGSFTARAENGTEASVLGKAFALDEDPDQGLFVNFSNYYYPEDSILLKKEDGLTGAGIGGAEFQIHQVHNGTDVLLKFNYDAETGIYSQSPDGTHSTIRTSDEGYVVIRGFSYQFGTNAGDENPNYLNGSIIITEAVSPTGYSPAPEITLGLNASNNVEVKAVGDLAESEWADYAELPSNEVLEIRNYNTDYVSVTANKVWDTLTPEQSVEVVLQANGRHATLEIPSLAGAQVVLNAQNNWTYTWEKLPRYANGIEVTWSIKEVKVGDAPTMADGVSFANWVPTYSPAAPTDTNGDGKTDNWSITVTNTKRRPMLTITKVDTEGAILPGATFKMETVTLRNGQWQVTGSQSRTTDGTGMTTFELVAGNYYRLTETSAPAGYLVLAEPVVLTVDGTGLVQQVNADGTLSALNVPYLTYTGVYNVRVTNLKLEPLPETGGAGTQRYAQSGLLLILLAAVLWIYNRLPGIPAAAAPRGQRRKFRQISTFRMLPPGPGPAPAEPVPRQGTKMHRKEESDTS